jgi:hypothetical protein
MTDSKKQLWLMITNVPKLQPGQKSNWKSPDIKAMKQHNTVDDRLWWADHSKKKLIDIRRNFREKNPFPFPSVRFTIRKINKIPDGD